MLSLRCLAASLTLLAAVGCSAPRAYSPPVDIPLQDPPPGKAIVYLVRAPYDSSLIAVFSGSAKLVTLPAETYTAVVLAPGSHVLTTRGAGVLSAGSEVAPPYRLQTKADERRFLNISGATSTVPVFTGVLPVSGAMIPLFMPQPGTSSGSLAWKEVTELDAQGLMSIANPVLPEKGAL